MRVSELLARELRSLAAGSSGLEIKAHPDASHIGVSSTKEINYFRRLYRKGDTRLHYDWRFPFDSAEHAWTLDVSELSESGDVGL